MTSWQCGYCERAFVVDSLARMCEAKHEAEVDEEQAA